MGRWNIPSYRKWKANKTGNEQLDGFRKTPKPTRFIRPLPPQEYVSNKDWETCSHKTSCLEESETNYLPGKDTPQPAKLLHCSFPASMICPPSLVGLVMQLSLNHFCSCKPIQIHWFIKFILGGICTLVCHQFPIWGEYTFIHISLDIVSHIERENNF